jgi:hypothetical protein
MAAGADGRSLAVFGRARAAFAGTSALRGGFTGEGVTGDGFTEDDFAGPEAVALTATALVDPVAFFAMAGLPRTAFDEVETDRGVFVVLAMVGLPSP